MDKHYKFMDKAADKNNPPVANQQQIGFALISSAYKQAKVGLLASLLCGSVILIYLFNLRSIPILLSWYTFFLLVILLRFILVNLFKRDPLPKNHAARWRNLFIIGAFLSGISWGVTGSRLLLPTDNSLQEAFIMVILAGISAGSVPLLAPIPRAAMAFLVPALLPLIIFLLAKKDPLYTFFIIAITVYLIYLIILSLKTYHIIKNSIQLQFENDSLLKNLSAAKNLLEATNQRLEQDATHDPLTRVANRSLFETHFQKTINHATYHHKILALLYLDLDNFKQVNDTFGHHAGDQLLLIVVARIKNILREQDVVSRLGGDELTIILEEVADIETVANVAERICQAIAEPVQLSDGEINNVHASIGISIFPVDGDNIDTLIRVADRAMYYVKDHGGNNYHFNVQLEKK
jgi:diguanylate cyclase (GGDEF)-like protein